MQVAADVLEMYEHGVWFIDLASITDFQLILPKIAATLGIRHFNDEALIDTVVRSLTAKRMLLIVDNCEHLVSHVSKVIDGLLQGCPNITILTTSREALELIGERPYRMPSLEVPPEPFSFSADELSRFGAIRLFVDRAVAVTSFTLTNENAQAVVSLCRRLDGIPLAIELAAARLKVLSVNQILSLISERFKILTGGSRNAAPRHQTMRALIDWSYDLLSEAEQRVFRKLAVFVGGCTLEGAAAVCAEDPESLDLIDILSELYDKSLIIAELNEEKQRYRFLESTGQYASEQLERSGEREAAARCHAQYFLRFAQECDANRTGLSMKTWTSNVEAESSNIRAAIEWAITQRNDPALGLNLAFALRDFWDQSPFRYDALLWFLDLRDAKLCRDDREALAKLHLAIAMLVQFAETRVAAKEAVGFARETSNVWYLAMALAEFGNASAMTDALEDAKAALEEALSIVRAEPDDRLLAKITMGLANVAAHRSDLESARELFEKAIYHAVRLEDDQFVCRIRSGLANAEFVAGNIELALRYFEESLGAARVSKNIYLIANQQANMATCLIVKGDFQNARQYARPALEFSRDYNDLHCLATNIEHFAFIGASESDTTNAAQLLGYADMLHLKLKYPRQPMERIEYEQFTKLLRNLCDAATLRELRAEGAQLSQAAAIEKALKIGERPKLSMRPKAYTTQS